MLTARQRMLKLRVPLRITRNHVVLHAVVSTRKRQQIVAFVIDTGSIDSYLSTSVTRNLDIPFNASRRTHYVSLGGMRFNKMPSSSVQVYAWAGKTRMNRDRYIKRSINLYGLRPTRRAGHDPVALPSILGLEFLREQRLSLHMHLDEGIAYLETQ